jgi:DNA-directed RNA polymerase subunit RPC12/RpoP
MQNAASRPILKVGGKMLERLRAHWCREFHTRTTWPVRGRYACLECGREFSVPWETSPPKPQNKARIVRVRPIRLARTGFEPNAPIVTLIRD